MGYFFWETQWFVEPFIVQDVVFFFIVSIVCMTRRRGLFFVNWYLYIPLALKTEMFAEVLSVAMLVTYMTWLYLKVADQP